MKNAFFMGIQSKKDDDDSDSDKDEKKKEEEKQPEPINLLDMDTPAVGGTDLLGGGEP